MKQQLVILIGLMVLFLPLFLPMRAKEWWLIGMMALGFAFAVASAFGMGPVHRNRTTNLIGLTGFTCLFMGLRWYKREGWSWMTNQTLTGFYQTTKLTGRTPKPQLAEWEHALQLLGLGLLVLSFWREWSGLR